ncbi:pantoate--beta-alanine ligase [Salibacterium aidingense]|uniref:pantoate--beta-alanine ligase n=1 Tax=Salibacterium aidingense TaxID=384933 RepID=UPI000411C360|nr:pantoate--beta-alanine ligase [Salibacterium aidingense]
MMIITRASAMRKKTEEWKQQGCSTGFVPTMGALHGGHLSLMNEARQKNDKVVVSIFVNPLQFGADEDYDTYPKNIEADAETAGMANVDVIFAPPVDELYPRPVRTIVHVEKGVQVLCGRNRPGHFDGVATVVMKLFQIIHPDNAYFGRKDAQQAAVVQNMADDFNLSIDIVTCRTIRETDGLAVSSRNIYLTEKERKQAPQLYKSLLTAEEKVHQGERDVSVLEKVIHNSLVNHTDAEIDYAEVLAYPELETFSSSSGQIILAAAIRFSKARLIDNIIVPLRDTKKGEKQDVPDLDEI